MLQIGSPKVKIIKEKIDGQEIENVKFEVLNIQGFTMKVKHSAGDDNTAKSILKKYISTLPECKTAYTNIQLIDEQGRIL